MSSSKDRVKVSGLIPFIHKEGEILILGSFPSVKSRKEDFYYAHPQNRFYKILSKLYKENTPISLEEKKAFLRKHKIALSDPIESCSIIGSADSSIKDVELGDLKNLCKDTSIKRIFCNGKTSYIYTQKCDLPYPITLLPSSSAANASKSLEELIDSWKIIQSLY